MFSLAILIGIYSYIIFLLGIVGLVSKNVIICVTLLYLIFTFFICKYKSVKDDILFSFHFLKLPQNNLTKTLLAILVLQIGINVVGVLGPELSFDALWYHLTLPKLYLQNHTVIHVPGNLLYYSDMPKLTEMLYTASLAFHGEILAKFLHFLFGLLTTYAIFKITKNYYPMVFAVLAAVIFYTNLVVGWESTTAYIDLTRSFFEILALWAFVLWTKNNKQKWLIESAVMTGLAITTKLLASGSLIIFTFLIGLKLVKNKKHSIRFIVTKVSMYWIISLLIPLPWFVFSYLHTGNPFSPFFTDMYKTGITSSIINPFYLFKELIHLFLYLEDPISPLYIILSPFSFLAFKKSSEEVRYIILYVLLAIMIWYLTPKTGGGRFVLPYLPAFSIASAAILYTIWKHKYIKIISIFLVICVSLISIAYRGIANVKYIPVVIGKEKKADFLKNHLNFSFGDFYDTDQYFKTHITSKDVVLLYGFHNLYYIDFPFIDSSWVKKGDRFNYIAVLDGTIPGRFSYWSLVYHNPKTHVKLYKLGDGITWTY